MVDFGGDRPPLGRPPEIKPPPQNLEEVARQRNALRRRRTNRDDFIIDPIDQGLNIPNLPPPQ